MKKLKTYALSAIVILFISFSDEAESKSLEIDRRLERAVEAWRNGTTLTQVDTDTDTDTTDSDGGIQISRWEADNTNAVTGSNREAEVIDPKTGIKYGCYLNKCWRSCKKGLQAGYWEAGMPAGYYNYKDLCDHGDNGNHWCYSDLGSCSYASSCWEAVKWGCFGTGTEPGRMVTGDGAPCPGFKESYCDTETKRSFGCDSYATFCWRSCDYKEKNCNHKGHGGYGYCYVDAGHCSILFPDCNRFSDPRCNPHSTVNKRCIVATVLRCANVLTRSHS